MINSTESAEDSAVLGSQGATEHFEMVLKGNQEKDRHTSEKKTKFPKSQKCEIPRQLQIMPHG